MKKIAVGLSGGIDSSYTAVLLKEQGYELIGLTGIMSDVSIGKAGQQAVDDARMVAEQLDIPFYAVDLRDSFKKSVIKYFENEYRNGRTPSPCVVCNPSIKFGALFDKAMELGAEQIATGHYVNVKQETDGLFHLYKGVDVTKDQSYFLCRLTQEHLRRAVFPLGGMCKKDVKAKLLESGLKYVQRGESQEICFIEDDDYVSYLEEHIDTKCLAGNFYDENGKLVSKHNGIHSYTVGQRKGLGVALGKPVYVTKIDAVTNDIYLCERKNTLSNSAKVISISWLGEMPSVEEPFFCDVQVRYRHKPSKAKIDFISVDEGMVCFDEPQFAIAPGQAAAFYRGNELLGGGWIG
jgi:tRNA-specific 2-thiouridylase